VKGTTVSSGVSPEEASTPAADLAIRLEPYDSYSPPEAPTPAADPAIRLEPYDSSSLG
jgi:hypothetical protein